MVDEDGYPDEQELKYIEEFDCSKEDVRVLINFIEGIWWRPDWGFTRTSAKPVLSEFGLTEERDDLMLELHTGGWSGNEDILRSLKKNPLFYIYYWEMSRIGGHEYFRFNEFKSWEVGAK